MGGKDHNSEYIMSHLFIVATPIGNLEDISFRAVRILQEADLILCEDTRVTKKLLDRYAIKKPLQSYHQHSKLAKTEYIMDILASGKNLALVSDAGTPGISDPGGLLVEAVVKRLGNEVTIVPIPGANAALAALSVCGFPTDRFIFLGFPPHKKGRKTFFEDIAALRETAVFYESKHRIEKALTALAEHAENRRIVVAREITKQFETMYRGIPSECLAALKNDDMRGEFVVVMAPLKI